VPLELQQDQLEELLGHLLAVGDLLHQDELVGLRFGEHQQGTKGVLGFLRQHPNSL
jgi:hypothetical protein